MNKHPAKNILAFFLIALTVLLSAKLQPGTETYSILTFFGGIRSLTYRYDDAQWAQRG